MTTIAERLADAGIEVKPLEWVDTEDDRGDGTSEHNGGYAADRKSTRLNSSH